MYDHVCVKYTGMYAHVHIKIRTISPILCVCPLLLGAKRFLLFCGDGQQGRDSCGRIHRRAYFTGAAIDY